MGTVFALLIFIFFGETARPIVGDGSIPPQSWNRSYLQMRSKGVSNLKPNLASLERRKSRPNPLTSLALLWDRENFILSVSGGLLYAGYSSVTSVLASQLQQRYEYDAVCRPPLGYLDGEFVVLRLLIMRPGTSRAVLSACWLWQPLSVSHHGTTHGLEFREGS